VFRDLQHPDVSLSDWTTFRREVSPFLVEKVLDRGAYIPAWFVPLARGVAVASPHLMARTGYRPGARRTRGWHKSHCDVFWKNIGEDQLVVRAQGQRSVWVIERNGY
jgi:hypothetical protein